MTEVTAAFAAFAAPGPGQWSLDTGHFPRPATRFTAELFPGPSKEGFAEGTAPYGLLFDHIEWAFVNGWAYLSARPVAAVGDAGALTRGSWDDLVRSSPDLADRLARSERVFADKVWRHDLVLWDEHLKPALVDSHRRGQSVQTTQLDDDGLLSHLDQCRNNLAVSIRTHHRFDVTPVLPVGELLLRCRGWSGAPAIEVLGLLQGAGPLAVGAATELARAAAAIRGDADSISALQSADARDVLGSLRSRSGAGQATSAYLDVVGHWSAGNGFDVDDPSLIELPELVVESLREAVARGTGEDGDDEAADKATELRLAVPAAERGAFDDALAEARLVHRLRDERALYCDVWANGLMRRAILAAGARLAERGLLQAPGDLVEASYDEMRSLLCGRNGPAAGKLAQRARHRRTADPTSVPPVLGHSSRTPLPLDWLPAGAARTEAAFRTYLAAMEGDDDDDGDEAVASSAVHGVGASPGVYEGKARVVHGAAGIGSVRRGDVLVTEAISPAFNIVLPLVGAVVTERGGILSHAAIVAREYGIPAVVGAGDSTRRIPDGARVRVDGSSGEVVMMGPPAVS